MTTYSTKRNIRITYGFRKKQCLSRYYTLNPNLPINLWDVQLVNSNELTTISDLQAQSIYSIRSQAFTTRGAGPLSPPVQVKTQQGVPSQPLNLLASSISATTVQLTWNKPSHTGESIIGYEIYWNDTFTNQEYKRAIPVVETYKLTDLYPDTLYYIWIAAKSRRGEGASTPPIPVKTDQYGKLKFSGFWSMNGQTFSLFFILILILF